jgi:hypothetical protein
MSDKLYRVLLPGIRQRSGQGWRLPEVGDMINVSDDGASVLISRGFICPADGGQSRIEVVEPTSAPPPEPTMPETSVATDADGGFCVTESPERCDKHPRYQGANRPREDCPDCQSIWRVMRNVTRTAREVMR